MANLASIYSRLSRPRWSRSRVREALYGYLYSLPWSVGFLLWVAIPLVASLYYSFTEYSLGGNPTFVGLANYKTALTSDDLFWPSLGRTFYYVALTVPLGIVGSLVLASVLNQELRGTTIFRGLFYLPSLTPAVAMAILWRWLLNPIMGPVNYLIKSWFGVDGPGWMGSFEWALPSLAIMALWGGLGGNRMLIFLAGLQSIPQEMYDAASIDGAGSFRRFVHVTVPLLTPTIFFNMVLGMIGALKVFASAFVATRGGPGRSTWFFALHIYSTAFEYFDMGYGSALAWLFFIVLLAITSLQFGFSKNWVYYSSAR